MFLTTRLAGMVTGFNPSTEKKDRVQVLIHPLASVSWKAGVLLGTPTSKKHSSTTRNTRFASGQT